MAQSGAFLYWEKNPEPEIPSLDAGAAALLWVDWARELGVDAVDMQVKLLALCARTRVHPLQLLAGLF